MTEVDLIALYAADGEFVVRVRVPQFRPRADAIMWGDRVFFHRQEHAQYREGVLYAVPYGMVERKEEGQE